MVGPLAQLSDELPNPSDRLAHAGSASVAASRVQSRTDEKLGQCGPIHEGRPPTLLRVSTRSGSPSSPSGGSGVPGGSGGARLRVGFLGPRGTFAERGAAHPARSRGGRARPAAFGAAGDHGGRARRASTSGSSRSRTRSRARSRVTLDTLAFDTDLLDPA